MAVILPPPSRKARNAGAVRSRVTAPSLSRYGSGMRSGSMPGPPRDSEPSTKISTSNLSLSEPASSVRGKTTSYGNSNVSSTRRTQPEGIRPP